MCDYSLHHVASRPAKVGDRLVASAFDGSATHGFCAVDAPGIAVCLRPGTELAFADGVETSRFRPGAPAPEVVKLGDKVARFTQVDMDRPAAYHDALELPNGKIVMVTHLRRGQIATVLQLPPTGEVLPVKTEEIIIVPEVIG